MRNISATAGSYGERIITGEDPTPSPLMGVSPADVNSRYVSADNNICTVDDITGSVTGVDEGSCRITLTLSRTGYSDKKIEYVIPVILSGGDFKGKHIFKGVFLGENTKPTFADVDGDGDKDLVVGLKDGTLKYYRKNPVDSPIAFTEQTGPDNPFNGLDAGTYVAPTFADVDGDGDQDLLTGKYDGALKYFLNESTESTLVFTEQTGADNPFNSFNVVTVSSPTFADVDGDDDPDMVLGRNDGSLKLYLNESTDNTITYTEKTNTENPFNDFDVGTRSAPTFADVDGDGDSDMVLGRNDGTLKFYLNESTSNTISFTEQTSTDNPFNGFDVGTGSTPTFADVDGDGGPDLVVGEFKGILNYFINESTMETITFTEKTSTDNPFNGLSFGNYTSSVFADIDGDSDLDLVAGGFDGTLKFYLNESTDNTISYTEKTNTENPFNDFDVGVYANPTFADIDRDGDLDLVVGNSTGTLNYFLNESTASSIVFTEKMGSTNNPFNDFDVGINSAPTFADSDGDGDLDLVVGNGTGTLNYFLNESTGGTIIFTEKTGEDNPFNGFDLGNNSTPTFTNSDGDGNLDLVVGNSTGTLNYFLNESTGGTIIFTEKTGEDNPLNGFDLGNNSIPIFTDIDGDGDQDLVVLKSETLIIFNYFGSWFQFL